MTQVWECHSSLSMGLRWWQQCHLLDRMMSGADSNSGENPIGPNRHAPSLPSTACLLFSGYQPIPHGSTTTKSPPRPRELPHRGFQSCLPQLPVFCPVQVTHAALPSKQWHKQHWDNYPISEQTSSGLPILFRKESISLFSQGDWLLVANDIKQI